MIIIIIIIIYQLYKTISTPFQINSCEVAKKTLLLLFFEDFKIRKTYFQLRDIS